MASVALLAASTPAAAGDAASPAESLGVTLDFRVVDGKPVAVMTIAIPGGYYAYAHTPGGAGRPAVLDFRLQGEPLSVWYPSGGIQQDYYSADATTYVYEGRTHFVVPMPGAEAGRTYRASLSLLLCSPRHCVPVSRVLEGIVPTLLVSGVEGSWFPEWQEFREASLTNGASGTSSSAPSAAPSAARITPAPAPASSGQGTAVLQKAGEPLGVTLTPRQPAGTLEVRSLRTALFVGILAGLILNVMPCVLPVLTLKVSGMLLVDDGDGRRVERFRQYNLFFAAGVMSFFTAMAGLLGLTNGMWGSFYQNPTAVFVMLLLVFLMSLSMLGVYTLPVIDMGVGRQSESHRLQAYLTGAVSTFLATPCSGPLLGGVLGWAFTQSLPVVMVVFWAVGLGMSLPYLAFGAFPTLARILPRPGHWMGVLERLLGFVLMGTAVYLFSLLPQEGHVRILITLLVAAAWVWLLSVLRRRPHWGPWVKIIGMFALACVATVALWAMRPPDAAPQWRAYDGQRFLQDLGNRPMLMEFTADWCPNCKFLEATVLTDARLRTWRDRYGLDFVRVDMTKADAGTTHLLESLGSRSLPFTALFPAGKGASSPMVLRDVYGVETLERAMEEAFGHRPAGG